MIEYSPDIHLSDLLSSGPATCGSEEDVLAINQNFSKKIEKRLLRIFDTCDELEAALGPRTEVVMISTSAQKQILLPFYFQTARAWSLP
jgi:hypothetical protein